MADKTEVWSPAGPGRPIAQDTLGRIQLARGALPGGRPHFAEALAAAEGLPEATRARLREGLARAQEGCDPTGR